MHAKKKNDKDFGGIPYLNKVDHLFLKQHLEILEILTHCETTNKYSVRNHKGQTVYYAIEASDCCARFCLCGRRSFDLMLFNGYSMDEICLMSRSLKCACCACCTHSEEMSLYLPNVDDPLGTVTHDKRTLGSNILSINNANGDSMLIVQGPKMNRCFSKKDYVFNIYNDDTEDISLGSIKKHWAGWGQEFLTSADNLSIVFPLNSDVKTKLLIMAAAFLVDYVFFE